ncbi:MAG: tetratricopeptide repeat protein [Chloroflexi bacterium]|nr:tetratricopeptide repeat protein [Chloroflexota bacterium]
MTPTATPFSIPARAYYDQGLVMQRGGELHKALESFDWAIRLSPDYAPAYVARGVVYLSEGQLASALTEANSALRVDPACSAAHTLRGEVLRRQGNARAAWSAFNKAVDTDPALADDTFRARWLVAREIGDSGRLLGLADEYEYAHPSELLTAYYKGWALIEAGASRAAIDVLIEGIESAPRPTALLWYALGTAYLENEAWREAIVSFENARSQFENGDTSLLSHTDQPVEALFAALGRAYLAAGRCVDAETMLNHAISVGSAASSYDDLLHQALVCQTPTPTATPYATTTPAPP